MGPGRDRTRGVYMILKECNLLRFFNNPQAMTRRHLTDLKKSLQSKFVKYWSVELHKSEKLRTYRKFKSIFMFENCREALQTMCNECS